MERSWGDADCAMAGDAIAVPRYKTIGANNSDRLGLSWGSWLKR